MLEQEPKPEIGQEEPGESTESMEGLFQEYPHYRPEVFVGWPEMYRGPIAGYDVDYETTEKLEDMGLRIIEFDETPFNQPLTLGWLPHGQSLVGLDLELLFLGFGECSLEEKRGDLKPFSSLLKTRDVSTYQALQELDFKNKEEESAKLLEDNPSLLLTILDFYGVLKRLETTQSEIEKLEENKNEKNI